MGAYRAELHSIRSFRRTFAPAALAAVILTLTAGCGKEPESAAPATPTPGASRTPLPFTPRPAVIAPPMEPETAYIPAPPPPPPVVQKAENVPVSIIVDGDSSDWSEIPPIIQDEAGNSARFDIVSIKAAQNEKYLFLLIDLAREIEAELTDTRTQGDIATIYLDTVYEQPEAGLTSGDDFTARLSVQLINGQIVASYDYRRVRKAPYAEMNSQDNPEMIAFSGHSIELKLDSDPMSLNKGQVIGLKAQDLNAPADKSVLGAYSNIPYVE